MVTIDSKYTKLFDSDHITKLKYTLLYDIAVSIRDFKNKLSYEVSNNIFKFLNMSKFLFMTYMRNIHRSELSSYFECEAYADVYNCYQNKFDAIIKKIKFIKREFVQFNLYLKDVPKSNKKKGDLKSVKYNNKNTDLSITLTYLARYGSENIIDIIKNKLYDQVDDNKKKYYDVIFRVVDKFGFDRLYELALRKRNRIIRLYNKPVEFKSLTFRGQTSRINTIIDYNSNKKSKISGFVSINIPEYKIIKNRKEIKKLIDIPVKLSNNYHGKLKNYIKSDRSIQYCYTIKINEKNKQVSVLLCKNGKRSYIDTCNNVVGIDVNLKHNLFALSTRDTYDFDRDLIKEYLKELNKIDNLKKQNKDYIIGKRKQYKINAIRTSIKHSTQRLIVSVCKSLHSLNVDHVVLENLTNNFKSSGIKNTEFNERYNRISHLLNIGSLKSEFKHIGLNYGIAVSYVQAEYTSQICPVCGCIHEENRAEQETFECIECGYKSNADINAAINIRNRVSETVFCLALLNKSTDGSFIPNNISHDKLKGKIQKCVTQIKNRILNKVI